MLKADVEELEALKELADELEESHAETEKQLQQELGEPDSRIAPRASLLTPLPGQIFAICKSKSCVAEPPCSKTTASSTRRQSVNFASWSFHSRGTRVPVPVDWLPPVADPFARRHSDLEHLRKQQATQETQSQTLSSQSQAMLNLNLKLQSTVLKSQVKAIDLELRELEAKQAGEHLSIIKVRPRLIDYRTENDN